MKTFCHTAREKPRINIFLIKNKNNFYFGHRSINDNIPREFFSHSVKSIKTFCSKSVVINCFYLLDQNSGNISIPLPQRILLRFK